MTVLHVLTGGTHMGRRLRNLRRHLTPWWLRGASDDLAALRRHRLGMRDTEAPEPRSLADPSEWGTLR